MEQNKSEVFVKECSDITKIHGKYLKKGTPAINRRTTSNRASNEVLIGGGSEINITDIAKKCSLFDAIKESNSESVVRKSIDAHDVNVTDNKGETALFYSVRQIDNESVVRALIDAGANVNITDNEGKTALFYAVQQRNNTSVVRALIDAGANVNITDNEGENTLLYAVRQSDNESVVCALIDAGSDVNITDNEGKTALFYAVQSDNTRMTQVLIEKGHSLTNRRDNYGRTPLFYAITKSRPLIDYLLEKKSSMYIKDHCNMNILSFFINHCISKSQDCLSPCSMDEIIDLIVQKGFRRNTVLETIMSVLFCKFPLLLHSGIEETTFSQIFEFAKTYATEAKDKSMIDEVLQMMKQTANNKQLCATLISKILVLLIELGADPNSADSDGNTALHYVSCLPFYGVSKDATMDLLMKLEEVGVQFDVTNHENETPLLFCLMLHDNSHQYEGNLWSTIKILTEVCGFLLNNGSNVEETTQRGDSVFHLTLKRFQHLLGRDKNPLLLNDAVILLQLFAKPGKRVINKKDGILNSPLHLWSSLEPSQQYFNDVPDARDVFSVFLKSILDIFLDCGAKVDSRNENDETPLHLCRTWIAVRLLIDAGANQNLLDSMGCTPLIVAAMNKTFLIKDDIFYPDVELHPKAFWKNALEKKLYPWMVSKSGESVLSILIESKALSLAKALVEVVCCDGYMQSDSIAVSFLNTVCKDRLTKTYWKGGLVEVILNSSKHLKTDLAFNFCSRNIIEASKTMCVDKVKMSIHWAIAKQLLSYGADCTISDAVSQSCLDIAKALPALEDLLMKFVNLEMNSFLVPWTSVSKRYCPILEKVAKGKERRCVSSFRYYPEPLGKGTFGHIFAGINEKDGREVAIKCIEKLYMQRQRDRREIASLTVLADCEQVVRYLYFFEDEHFSYVVLELMEGNLEEFLEEVNAVAVRELLCLDVIKGISFIHSHCILHRDLKPANILYKAYPKLCLKIADFGLSFHMDSTGSSTTVYESNVGTRCWSAPEVLMSTKHHSKSSDVFACGLVLHYILSQKKHPFAPKISAVQYETEANIANGLMEGWDDSLGPEATCLVRKMLASDKQERPSADKAFNHPFFWTKKKKMDLIIVVGSQPEFGYPCAKRTLPCVENDLEANFGTTVKYRDWNDPRYANMPFLYTAMTNRRKSYDTHSVVELVRFMRNAYVLVTASTRPTTKRKLLLEDFVFFEYFPNLVMEVYKAVTSHRWDQTRDEIKFVLH